MAIIGGSANRIGPYDDNDGSVAVQMRPQDYGHWRDGP